MTTLDLRLALDEPPPPRRDRARRFADRARRPDAVAAGAVAATALVLALANPAGSPAYQDDEGIYAAQAVAVQEGRLAPYTYWYDHPPLGWIQLAVLGALPRALEAGDGSAIAAMRVVIAFFFAAAAVLVLLLIRRVGAPLPFAVLGAAIFVFSPLSLELGRQVFLDAIAMPWILLAFLFALSPHARLSRHIGAGAAFAIASLTKLTSAIFGPALLVALLDRPSWPNRRFSVVGFLTIGALVLAAFPLMAVLRGELLAGAGHVSLMDGLVYQFAARKPSGFLWEAGSGRQQLVQGWLGLDAFVLIAGLLAAVVCLASRSTRWVPIALLTFAVPVVASQGYLPAMYIIGGVPFLCIAIGAAAGLFWRRALDWTRRNTRGAHLAASALTVGLLAAVIAPMPLAAWAERSGRSITQDENADWRAALEWTREHLPRDEVVLAPFSMWQELAESGWDGPWRVIALEKADLDSEFAEHHPGGWTDIDWIVEGPTVEPNLRYLDLQIARSAYEHSEVVASFGAWHIRRVDHP